MIVVWSFEVNSPMWLYFCTKTEPLHSSVGLCYLHYKIYHCFCRRAITPCFCIRTVMCFCLTITLWGRQPSVFLFQSYHTDFVAEREQFLCMFLVLCFQHQTIFISVTLCLATEIVVCVYWKWIYCMKLVCVFVCVYVHVCVKFSVVNPVFTWQK